MKLASYTEYKESSSPAATKIPVQWSVHRCRYLFREVDERSKDGHETHLSMSQKQGLIASSKIDKKRLQSESYAGGKLCEDGDLVLNRLKAHLGVFAHAKQSGVVSPDYTVLRPISADNPRFFEYLFKSPLFITEFTKSAKGIVKGFWRLYTDDFYSIRAFVPPPDEQRQILRFIDSLSAQTSKLVRNRRRLIELLREQKQNIINQAVTRGLNPDVKLKPSGVEWIGDIPEHWGVAPLKHLASINVRTLPESTDGSYTFKYFDISSVGTGRFTGEPEKLCFSQAPSRARRVLKKGDTILSTVRTYLKAVYYVSDEVDDWIASTGFAVLTPKKELHPPFLGLLIQSDNFIDRVITESIGVAYPAIAETKLSTLHLAYPKSFEEQQAILEFIADSSKTIEKKISLAEREIELIREYRTRLISDVVTGQVDVRDIEVPEIPEEELPELDEESIEQDDVIEDEGEKDETD